MNKFNKIICAACTLVLVNTGVLLADASNFAGPYVGITASGYGMQLSGTSRTSPTPAATPIMEVDEVSIGQVAPLTGFEAGYVIPLGSMFLIDIGASYYTGSAKLEYHHDAPANPGPTTGDLANKDVSFTIGNLTAGYFAPTLVLSDTSSLYVKVGLSEAQVKVSGDITSPGDLSGETWAVGTRTVLPSGVFIRTEAGYTDYNGISAVGKGTNIETTNSYAAEPTVAFGTISLGFRF